MKLTYITPIVFIAFLCTYGNIIGQDDIEKTEKLKVVEVMPRFPGCEQLDGSVKEKEDCGKGKMLQFIYSNLHYPNEARENGIEGMCVVQFIITPEGNVSNVKLVRDIGGGCGTEAIRIVNNMNSMEEKWNPGLCGGIPCDVKYTLPIRFKIDKEKKKTKLK